MPIAEMEPPEERLPTKFLPSPGRRRRGKALCWSIAAVCALMTVTSCGSQPPLPPKPAMVTVKITEYRFDYPDIPSGRVVFRVVNRGRLEHRLALIPLPEDFPSIRVQLSGSTRRAVNPLASLPNLPPGSTTTFAADLARGRYALVDFLADRDGVSFARKGAASEFRVR